MIDATGVKLEQVAVTELEATFSVVADGGELGKINFGKWYEPVIEPLPPYVALWAGLTLCIIDREHRTMRCVERDDETHRVHALESAWVIEGELSIELFDPNSGTAVATYSHNEVITNSSVADGLVHIEDFAGATVTLDPRRSLQVVGRGSVGEKSDARSH